MMNMGSKLALMVTFFLICSGNCLKCYTCKKSASLNTCNDQEQGELKECDVGETYCELSHLYEEGNILLNDKGQDFS